MTDDHGAVLDASALVALLNSERGADVVAAHLHAAVVSAVNWSETYGALRRAGVDGDALAEGFAETGIEVVPFDADDARATGELSLVTRDAGLSLGDRACLALARRLDVPAVTADRAWLNVDAGIDVVCVR
jgi:ribonuclease VapC